MTPADKEKVSAHFRSVVGKSANADKPIAGVVDPETRQPMTPRKMLENGISSGHLFAALDDYMSKTGKTLDEVIAQDLTPEKPAAPKTPKA